MNYFFYFIIKIEKNIALAVPEIKIWSWITKMTKINWMTKN